MGPKKRRCSYTVSEKLAAIDLARRTSKSNAARELHIDVRRVREWTNEQEEQLRSTPRSKKRLSGGGKKPHDAAVDRLIFDWFKEIRQHGFRVTGKQHHIPGTSIFSTCASIVL